MELEAAAEVLNIMQEEKKLEDAAIKQAGDLEKKRKLDAKATRTARLTELNESIKLA